MAGRLSGFVQLRDFYKIPATPFLRVAIYCDRIFAVRIKLTRGINPLVGWDTNNRRLVISVRSYVVRSRGDLTYDPVFPNSNIACLINMIAVISWHNAC